MNENENLKELEEKTKPLDIPTNISDRNDIIQGIGAKEASIIGIALLLNIIFAVISFLTTGNPFTSIGIPIFVMAMLVVLIIRDLYNESAIDKIRFLLIYAKAQKKYEYRQYFMFGQEGRNDSE